MKLVTQIILSFLLTIVVTAAIYFRFSFVKEDFDQVVAESKAKVEGYDQEFITMVDNLEAELALRANFPYLGGKDPMTGKIRNVAVKRYVPVKYKVKKINSDPIPPRDNVRLTAIIFDDIKDEFSAIMMVGERSYSVEEGDKVAKRLVSKITERYVYLASVEADFRYDINGKVIKKLK